LARGLPAARICYFERKSTILVLSNARLSITEEGLKKEPDMANNAASYAAIGLM
jgi:hypothetical protein